jgi:DNA-binding transcriptional regulator YdaS (Cro superfamily)
MDTPNPVRIAINAAGGQVSLAQRVGVRQQSISDWLKRARIPAERVLAVERATGISRHELRPDLYPREQAA